MRCRSRHLLMIFFLLGLLISNATAQGPVDIFGKFFDEAIRQGQQQRAERLKREQEAQKKRQETSQLAERLQIALRTLGYYRGAIDGQYGTGTRAATSAYFSDHGISLPYEITEAHIAQIEIEARNTASQPTAEPNYHSSDTASTPDVVYNPVTPEDLWKHKDFAQIKLADALSIKAPEHNLWAVVASGNSLESVMEAAKNYAEDFPSTLIIRSSNNRFAILIGWIPTDLGRDLLDGLKRQSIIPSDAFLSSGEKFVGPFWATGAKSIKSRQDILRYALLRSSPSLWAKVLANAGSGRLQSYQVRVAGLAEEVGNSSYLSLRKEPTANSEELSRMGEGTVLSVLATQERWQRVKTLTGLEGWAASKYLKFNDATDMDAVAKDDTLGATEPSQDRQDELNEAANQLIVDMDSFLKLPVSAVNATALADGRDALKAAVAARDYAKVEAVTASLRQALQDAVRKQAEFDKAVKDAKAVLDDLGRPKSANVAFKDKFQIGRLQVDLEAAIEANETVAITRASDALSAALAAEPSFSEFISNEEDARKTAEFRASEEGNRIDAFLKDYYERNFGKLDSKQLRTLNQLRSDIDEARTSDQPQHRVEIVSRVKQDIDALGLAEQLQKFAVAPTAKPTAELAHCLELADQSLWSEAQKACEEALAQDRNNAQAIEAAARIKEALQQEQDRQADLQKQRQDLELENRCRRRRRS